MDVDVSIEEKLASLEKKYKESQNIIKMLNEKILFLETKNVSKDENYDSITIIDDVEEKIEEQFNIAKKSGYRREGPQVQPLPSKIKSMLFKCNECEVILESSGLLIAHEQHHRKNDKLMFVCDYCELNFGRKNDLEAHVVSNHKDQQFNCDECSYQGNEKIELVKHMYHTKHQPSNSTKLSSSDNYSCHSCGEKYGSKEDLMKHRKTKHFDIIKKCRYFAQGNCGFESKICWYRHDEILGEDLTHHEQPSESFICKFCELVFKRKSDFMIHKKLKHGQAVPKCREYQKGKCLNIENECWYKHDEMIFVYETSNESESVFQMAPENNHPPEMIKRIIDMMEKLIMKVERKHPKI